MFKELYLHLKNNGLHVYSIGQHKGTCKGNYVVIRELGDTQITGKNLIKKDVELLLYVPLPNYSKVNDLVEEVKRVMRGLQGYRREINGNPVIIDDDKQAYMTYLSYKRIGRI